MSRAGVGPAVLSWASAQTSNVYESGLAMRAASHRSLHDPQCLPAMHGSRRLPAEIWRAVFAVHVISHCLLLVQMRPRSSGSMSCVSESCNTHPCCYMSGRNDIVCRPEHAPWRLACATQGSSPRACLEQCSLRHPLMYVISLVPGELSTGCSE